jgi:hypothetical protein
VGDWFSFRGYCMGFLTYFFFSSLFGCHIRSFFFCFSNSFPK